MYFAEKALFSEEQESGGWKQLIETIKSKEQLVILKADMIQILL